MGCICSKFDGEEYICNVTGDRCLYYIPNGKKCVYLDEIDSECEEVQ